MPYQPIKPFLTYSQQLYKLSVEKNLQIMDLSAARTALTDICYYTLIDGYKNLFYNSMTRQYFPGTDFHDILSLYHFDQSLRELIFRFLCSIEQKMRSLISYHFSETYSHLESDYLNPANYHHSKKNSPGITKLIYILSMEAKTNTNHAYVVYQRKTYGNVPLWVIMNTLTFGQISKMYSFFTTSLQSKISKNFSSVNEKELSQYLKVLTHFRNVCAHNERLFSFCCRIDIPNTRLHQKLSIPKKGSQYLQGKSDLFAIIIIFRYLLSPKDFRLLKKELSYLIDKLLLQSPVLKKSTLLDSMGFPSNWDQITRYKP